MIHLIIKLDNIRQIALIMYTYNRSDLQIIEEKQSLPRVEKVLKYYLGICMRLALGLTADCICRMFQSFAFDCT